MATRIVTFEYLEGAEDFLCTDSVLDATDWGNGIEDSVRFLTMNGGIIDFRWEGVLYVRESNVPVAPPVPPPAPLDWGVVVHMISGGGGQSFNISEAVKDQMLADLTGVDSEDFILTFDTLNSYRVRLPSKKLALIYLTPQS